MGIAVQQNGVPQLVGRLPDLISDHLGRPMPNAEFHGVTVRRRFLSNTPASGWCLNRQQHATLISTAQKFGQKRADQYLPLATGPGACTVVVEKWRRRAVPPPQREYGNETCARK